MTNGSLIVMENSIRGSICTRFGGRVRWRGRHINLTFRCKGKGD
ncbi:hypothetical protein ACHAWF_007511 [Thalassiosira exigua]